MKGEHPALVPLPTRSADDYVLNGSHEIREKI